MSFLLFIIIPVITVIGVIVCITSLITKSANATKTRTEKDGDVMLKNIYTYLILFATLMMTIGGSVAVFMGIADYIAPSTHIQSYDNYKESRIDNGVFDKGKIALTEEAYQEIMQGLKDNGLDEKIREDYEQMKQDKQTEAKADALRHIIKSLGWIVIPLPVFLYFQRRKNKETEQKE